ncbi:RNase A-like domain-containing protein [Candidatus Raskinella chloraquaticus]|uniref:RNase A-like domain-containing protein n=1 Tax=Candidatus Raskinella chloraquaticus TaxID=1951219 RepID=UPI00366DE51A
MSLPMQAIRSSTVPTRLTDATDAPPSDSPSGTIIGTAPDGTPIVAVADNSPSNRYNVVLEEEERNGGHTLRRHVGLSDEELIDYVRQRRMRLLDLPGIRIDSYLESQGSFTDIRSANDYVNRVLETNSYRLDAVASGLTYKDSLEMRFGKQTGHESFATGRGTEIIMRPTYSVKVIIEYDQNSTRGYRVRSAYPFDLRKKN